MMMWDRKKAVQMIRQKRMAGGGEIVSGPAPMQNEVVKDADGEIDGRHVASQDMMSAIHEKSPEKLMHAMSAFMDLHASQGNKPESKE